MRRSLDLVSFGYLIEIIRFEGMLTNEFRTLKSSCSDLVPRGPGYESVNVTNQVCSTVGALPGQSFVDGRRFVQMSFGYTFSNIWRVC